MASRPTQGKPTPQDGASAAQPQSTLRSGALAACSHQTAGPHWHQLLRGASGRWERKLPDLQIKLKNQSWMVDFMGNPKIKWMVIWSRPYFRKPYQNQTKLFGGRLEVVVESC